jgi:hypothetical protein
MDLSPPSCGETERIVRPSAMSRNRFLLLTTGIVILASAGTFGLRVAWDRWLAPRPILEYPTLINMGNHDRGEVVFERFQVKNVGHAPLELTEFQTSCSCAGVEREVDGTIERLRSVTLAPGHSVELLVRLGVAVRPGESQLVHIGFTTNDPLRPAATIDVVVPTVTGGIWAEPKAVILGSVLLGGKISRIVNLYDDCKSGRQIESVRSTNPDRFQVRLMGVATPGADHISDVGGGKFIAQVEVAARTEQVGSLEGNIEVYLAKEGRSPDLIPVAGQVVAPMACLPSQLVLPRRVQGDSVYSGRVLCFSRTEQPLGVEILGTPSDTTVKVSPISERRDQSWLEIEYKKPKTGRLKQIPSIVIPLRLSSGGDAMQVNLPIRFAEAVP